MGLGEEVPAELFESACCACSPFPSSPTQHDSMSFHYLHRWLASH